MLNDSDCRKPILIVAMMSRWKNSLPISKGFATFFTAKKWKRINLPIASQTKAITSTAVILLWEEGKFQLTDPILR